MTIYTKKPVFGYQPTSGSSSSLSPPTGGSNVAKPQCVCSKKHAMELLKAKEAIFELIGQFHSATKFDDGELYIYNYCESALELAFSVLGIEENYIKLTDFCQMWEDNTRAIWGTNLSSKPFDGITADIHYDVFKEDYERRLSWANENDNR